MKFPRLSNRRMAHNIPSLGRKKIKGDGFLYCSDIMTMSGRSRRQSIRILRKMHRAEKYDGVHYRIKDTPITRDFFTKYRKHMRRVRASKQNYAHLEPTTKVMNFFLNERRRGRPYNPKNSPHYLQNVTSGFLRWRRYVLDNDSPDYWTIEQIEKFFVEIEPIWDFVTKIIEREAALKKNTAGQSPD